MQVGGTYEVACSQETAWRVLMDPEILQRAIPGCKVLQETEKDKFDAEFELGVAAIKGTYKGQVDIKDKKEPEEYKLQISASGTAGFVRAEITFTLQEAPSGTVLTYEGDAQVGGLIAGVGQRVIGGTAKLIAKQFFGALMKEIQAAS